MPRGILLPEASALLGVRIAIQRKKLSIPQKELAQRADICRPTLSSYERGLAPITVEKLIIIAQILETPLEYFLEGLDRTR